MTRVPRRDRSLRRFRWLDVFFGVGVVVLLAALVLTRTLSFFRCTAVIELLAAPLSLWMSWRQYVILDEYGRINLLKAYAVAGMVALAGLLLLMAGVAWLGTRVPMLDALLALSVVVLIAWLSSWVVWFRLRRGHGS